MGRRVLVVVVAVAALIVVSAYVLRDWRHDGDRSGAASTAVGLTRVPPDERSNPVSLSGTTLEEEPLDSSDWLGRVVVVNVWGSWCGPCRSEAPDLASAYRKTRQDRVEFVGIDVRDNRAAALAFTRQFGVEYPSFFDVDSSLLLSLEGAVPVSAVPSTLVLDAEGRVAATVVGTVDRGTLLGLIADTARESALPDRAPTSN